MTEVVLGPAIEPVQPMAPGIEAQNALHWLVRMATSFNADATARDGFGLRWHADRGIILTPELVDGVRLELRLPELSFQFHEGDAPSPHVLVLDDKSSAEIEAWLLVEMLHRGFDRDRFSKVLPYEAQELMSGDEPKYEAEEHGVELAAIAGRMVRADAVLREAQQSLGAPETADGSLVVWPQSCSIGFLTGASDGTALKPVVRVAFALDADRDGHPAFVVDRFGDDGGSGQYRRTLQTSDGAVPVADLIALVRDVEATAQQ